MYITDSHLTKSILETSSNSYVNDIILEIENPNLLELNKLRADIIIYNGEKYIFKNNLGK